MCRMTVCFVMFGCFQPVFGEAINASIRLMCNFLTIGVFETKLGFNLRCIGLLEY